ncbi:formyltetrahydrofolate deformylase [Bacillus sp. 1P06AnD]|uniref:formyltetrahydrofolate deformylase n=1 Tax=Bacillus sp. 1P06AnD TaxID=3132208 RepID=UPI0039A2D328
MKDLMKEQQKDYQEVFENRGRLLIKCPDQPGIVSAVSAFLFSHGANIIESNQYTSDPNGGVFFLRMEFEQDQLNTNKAHLEEEFQCIAETFAMEYSFRYVSHLKKIAIFVSKELHCLLELLWEYQSGDLMADIALVISNHPEAKDVVEPLGIPFIYMEAHKDIRREVEKQQISYLKAYKIELIVLARYMQILTPEFVQYFPNQIINIHHSFLPAFIGARPYERAYERGVKIIGATSHYVTNDLDEGPIIEQDIKRVTHRDHTDALKRIGRSIERSVLARAVKWHVEDRVIVEKNKTIIF